MRKKSGAMLSVLALVGAALLSGPAIWAQGPGGGRGFGGPGPRFEGPGDHSPFEGRFFARLADKLELTEQQRDQVEAILQEQRSQIEPLREELRSNHEALREASQFGAFFANEAEITALAQRQGELHGQMIVARERVKAQIYEVLTPEQQTKLQELAQLMGEFGRGGHHRRGH